MSDLHTTIHNEQVKLSAVWKNGLALSVVAIGGFATATSFVINQPDVRFFSLYILFIGACFGTGEWMHRRAKEELNGLLPVSWTPR